MDHSMDRYIGKLLDNRYEIQEIVGTGGMAIVYKALCHRLNRMVAVKILKDELAADEEFRRRFHAESQAVAQLSHPNIVSAFDVSKSEEVEYIVMEFIDGMTLKQYMQRKGVLPWREALHYITQITKALNHAHSRGIIHRDVKPHNIMLLRDGSVKVADFGIARFASVQNTLTKEALGSVHYISPEQARGSQIDVRSDIYSAGVVLYEMLTGRLPYEGDSPVSVAIQHINSMPLTPRDINPDIPAALEAITMKAMAPNIQNRYLNTEEMLNDLEEFRKNPSIVFEYQGGVNQYLKEEPTRVIKPVGLTGVPSAGTEKPKTNQARPAVKKKKGFKNKNVAYLVGVLGILVVVGILFMLILQIFRSIIEPREQVIVESFIGRTWEDIQSDSSLSIYNFLEPGEAFCNEQRKGLITAQIPEAGEEVRAASNGKVPVTVIISLGPAPVMPNLIDRRQADAERELAALEIPAAMIHFDEEASEEIEIGRVTRTEPAAGTDLSTVDTIVLYISRGVSAQNVVVPKLVGEQRDIAEALIIANNLTIGTVDIVPAAEGLRNQVIWQEPAAESEVTAGTAVNLRIVDASEGNEFRVPNLVGKEANAAITEVDGEGRFVVSIAPNRIFSDTVPEGHIISQDPASGTEHPAGTAISVTLSRGREVSVLPMPNVNGETATDARQALRDLNLTIAEELQEHSDTVAAGRVIGTVPAAGEPQPRDGNVTMVISLGRDADEPHVLQRQRYPVRLPERPGNVRVQVFQTGIAEPIYDVIHSTAENRIYFEAGGSPDDIIIVLFDDEQVYSRPLGQLTPAN
jgi:serine/threonine-protein kinase